MNTRIKILNALNRICSPKASEYGIGLGDALAYGKECDGTPYWRTLIAYFTPTWWYYVLEHTVCRWRGHDWMDESCINGDTGIEAGRCERCGYSWRHIYY